MDVINAMILDAGVGLKELRVDGGASANDLLMQFQANVLGQTVIRPQTTETTALGAAYLAGLAVGYWSTIDEIKKQWSIDKKFEPDPAVDLHLSKRKWIEAVHRSQSWIK
jgi:glycerol kinase